MRDPGSGTNSSALRLPPLGPPLHSQATGLNPAYHRIPHSPSSIALIIYTRRSPPRSRSIPFPNYAPGEAPPSLSDPAQPVPGPARPTRAHLAQPAGERAEAHGVEQHRLRRPPGAHADAHGGQLGARPGEQCKHRQRRREREQHLLRAAQGGAGSEGAGAGPGRGLGGRGLGLPK